MTYHSPPVMVAIGLLGDEAERNQSATTRGKSSHGNRHRSSRLDAGRQMTRLKPGFHDTNGEFFTPVPPGQRSLEG